METDSLYIAFARDTIDDCVKPELRETWTREKFDWFSSDDKNTLIEFEGQTISLSQFDNRRPGRFKAEFIGIGMPCLNSKVYTIFNDDTSKTSRKESQKKRNELLREHFLPVLNIQKPHSVENDGFIKDSRSGTIKTYTQEKVGMGYFCGKREVLEDGVLTTHLDIRVRH